MNWNAFYDQLRAAAPGLELRRDEPMSRHTTFRVGGPAALMALPRGGEVKTVIETAFHWNVVPLFLGNGSNLLAADEGLDMLVVHTGRLDGLERTAPKLLHSKTGACMARHVFGEPDEVYEAIFWHTTAKENMTTLEKILYVADYMEPNRSFDGVERLRQLAYSDLDKALLLGVETTIQEMKDRNLPVHRSTLRAQAWLREQGVTTEG